MYVADVNIDVSLLTNLLDCKHSYEVYCLFCFGVCACLLDDTVTPDVSTKQNVLSNIYF